MAKKKLLIENDYEFFLFGISCPEKAYRLCSALNSLLDASFSKSKDMEVQGKKKDTRSKFPVFSFRDEEMFTDYRIIVNKASNNVLIPEYKQADFLLMVQGGIPSYEKANVLKKIKEIVFIQTVFEIDPKKIKSKDNFVF